MLIDLANKTYYSFITYEAMGFDQLPNMTNHDLSHSCSLKLGTNMLIPQSAQNLRHFTFP